jgi:hypothetical protein
VFPNLALSKNPYIVTHAFIPQGIVIRICRKFLRYLSVYVKLNSAIFYQRGNMYGV